MVAIEFVITYIIGIDMNKAFYYVWVINQVTD